MTAILRCLPPTSEQSEYDANDLIVFDIPIDIGMALIPGSVYVTGNLTVTKAGGAALTLADGVGYDAKTGIGGYIDQTSTSILFREGGSGQVENNVAYPRYLHTLRETSQSFYSSALQSRSTMELVCGIDEYTPNVLLGQVDPDAGNVPRATGVNSFTHKLQVATNNASAPLDGRIYAAIHHNITLRSEKAPLTWSGVLPAGTNWKITDLNIHYMLIPVDLSVPPARVTATAVIASKSTVSTSSTTKAFSPPGTIASYTGTFIKADLAENENSLQTAQLPGLNAVRFEVSGADTIIRFPLKSEEEITLNYIMSMNPTVLQSDGIYGNLTGYGSGIGFLFPMPIDFSKTTFTVNLECDSTQFSGTWSWWSYFTSIITL